MAWEPETTEAWAQFARELGLRLRQARADAGLTQEQVVELAGISLYSYQQYERGAAKKDGTATNPRLATILVLCQALNISVETLLPPVPTLTTR